MVDVEAYDAIVIELGQASGPLATPLAQSGRKTMIVERKHVGVTCVNEGCTPTKTMVASARVAYLARRAADYGVIAPKPEVNLRRVRQRKRDIVEGFRSGSERRLRETEKLHVLMADARIVEPKQIELHDRSGTTRRFESDLIFINTGARPAIPKIDSIDSIEILDSITIMELSEVPDRLIVVGGGYVGIEFAQMFRRFGSKVSIVQRGPRLLGREDPEIADAVAGILEEDGIELLLESEVTRVEPGSTGIRITIRTNVGAMERLASHVLAAAGRSPNTDALRVDLTGIQLDKRGFIQTNERLETNVPSIYALGDVKGGPAFTHISYDDFRIIRTNVIEGGQAATTGRFVPYVVYMDPQLGRVGLTETEAREQGRHFRIARMPMSSVARALEVDESRGLMTAVVDADNDHILGCAVLGLEGGELMSMIQIAMMGKLPFTSLRDGIFAHPTLAESLNNLFGSLNDV